MLDAVYFDTKATKSIVAVRPKPPFKPIFQVAASKEGSGIRITNEPPSVGSSVFVVEAGESRTIPETTFERLLRWIPDGGRRFDWEAAIANPLLQCSTALAYARA